MERIKIISKSKASKIIMYLKIKTKCNFIITVKIKKYKIPNLDNKIANKNKEMLFITQTIKQNKIKKMNIIIIYKPKNLKIKIDLYKLIIKIKIIKQIENLSSTLTAKHRLIVRAVFALTIVSMIHPINQYLQVHFLKMKLSLIKSIKRIFNNKIIFMHLKILMSKNNTVTCKTKDISNTTVK